MKRWMLLPLTALACLTFLSACGEDETDAQEREQQQQAGITNELRRNGELDPSAEVEFSRDEKGNVQFTYENADGSSGGGVILD